LLWLPFCMNMHEQLSSYKPSKHATHALQKKNAEATVDIAFCQGHYVYETPAIFSLKNR